MKASVSIIISIIFPFQSQKNQIFAWKNVTFIFQFDFLVLILQKLAFNEVSTSHWEPTACPGFLLWFVQHWLAHQGFEKTLELGDCWSQWRMVCWEISSFTTELEMLTPNSTLHYVHGNFFRLFEVMGLKAASATLPGSFRIHINPAPQQRLQFMCMWSCGLKYIFYLHISKEARWVRCLHWQ